MILSNKKRNIVRWEEESTKEENKTSSQETKKQLKPKRQSHATKNASLSACLTKKNH